MKNGLVSEFFPWDMRARTHTHTHTPEVELMTFQSTIYTNVQLQDPLRVFGLANKSGVRCYLQELG